MRLATSRRTERGVARNTPPARVTTPTARLRGCCMVCIAGAMPAAMVFNEQWLLQPPHQSEKWQGTDSPPLPQSKRSVVVTQVSRFQQRFINQRLKIIMIVQYVELVMKMRPLTVASQP